jgi:hypothetical protein
MLKYISYSKQIIIIIGFCSTILLSHAQTLTFTNKTHQQLIGKAWNLAIWTIDTNTTKQGLLKAGAGYGGEWTRDASMNSWNAASLLRTPIAEHTLWSVTKNKDTIGHQYWDKIVWVIAAWNHYLVTGNTNFLQAAYNCSKKSMQQLQLYAYNSSFKLFTGPGNINDGIAAYPEPIFDNTNTSSYVLDHPTSKNIMVLSTNLLYMQAFNCLNQMANQLHEKIEAKQFQQQYQQLQQTIIQQFYLPQQNKLAYIIYPNGEKVIMQEGLGYSYALLFNLLTKQQAVQLINNTQLSPFGIVNIAPHLPRYNDSLPGRHNYMVWPFINAYWANAVANYALEKQLLFELKNQSHLALDSNKGNNNFEEVAEAFTGKPNGGWQSNRQWSSKDHQTWNATGFCRMIIHGLFGLHLTTDGIAFKPCLPKHVGTVSLQQIPYRNTIINITIKGIGSNIQSFTINGKKANPFLQATSKGQQQIVIILKP